MELDEEEIIRLYLLFKNMSLNQLSVSEYSECPDGDTTMLKLQQKVKTTIESKGPEWMKWKKIRKWW